MTDCETWHAIKILIITAHCRILSAHNGSFDYNVYTIRASFCDAYNKILEDIRLQILKEPDSIIIGTTTDELADYYYSNKHYDPVKIDMDRTEPLQQKNEVRMIRADQREDSYRDEGDLPYEYESIHVTIPIVHNAHISALLNM